MATLESLSPKDEAINREARSIDSETPAGAIPLPSNMARQMAQQPENPATSAMSDSNLTGIR